MLLLACVVLSSLSFTSPGRSMRPWVRPVAGYLGVQQRWAVFAPNPRREVLDLYARLDYADTTYQLWRRPGGDRLVGAYRWFRWNKLLEFASPKGPAADPDVLRELAAWLARAQADPRRILVQVTLIERSYRLGRPGTPEPAEPMWVERPLFSLTVRPDARGQR